MERISKGVTREWLDENRIVVYTVSSLGVQTLMEWSQIISDSLKTWPKGADYVAVHDLSRIGMSIQYLLLTNRKILDPWLTATSESQFQEWLNENPEAKVRFVLVVSSSVSGQMTMRLGRTSLEENPRFESRVFDDRDAALVWLRKSTP